MQLDSIKRAERQERKFQKLRGALVGAFTSHRANVEDIYERFMNDLEEDETSNGDEQN